MPTKEGERLQRSEATTPNLAASHVGAARREQLTSLPVGATKDIRAVRAAHGRRHNIDHADAQYIYLADAQSGNDKNAVTSACKRTAKLLKAS